MPPRTLHVEHCIGTVFSVDIRDRGDWSIAIAELVARLHHVDAIFSTYRPDSDISRMRRGELRLKQAHPDVAVVLGLCADAYAQTGGAFSAMFGGQLDPTGLVKGWSIEQAGEILRRHGAENFCVNGGGDVLLRGRADAETPWRAGILDPRDRARVLCTVEGGDLAVATSGTYERGPHIIDPRTGRPALTYLGVTVVASSITDADVLATAGCVLGQDAPRWFDEHTGYDALMVPPSGPILTAGHGREAFSQLRQGRCVPPRPVASGLHTAP